MKFSARSCTYYEDTEYRVTDVVITDTTLSVDWLENGYAGHLSATSSDGVVYTGHYGFPRPEARFHIKLERFVSAAGEVLLFGTWWRTDSPDGGVWVFRLTPTPAT